MRVVGLFLMLGILDCCVIISARELLLDFLRGGTSKKNFRRVSQSQHLWQKATLTYIRDFIREPAFLRPFRFYAAAYHLFLLLLPVQLALGVLTACGKIPFPEMSFASILYCLGWGVLFSWEHPGKRHSRYAGRKYRKGP